MDITRLHGKYKGRTSTVCHGGLVYAVVTDVTDAPTMAKQTRNALTRLEANLQDAGSGKDCLLSVTVYITDMTLKSEMDAVWCDWIGGEENWPQRACVGTNLAGATLVEIVVTAAQR